MMFESAYFKYLLISSSISLSSDLFDCDNHRRRLIFETLDLDVKNKKGITYFFFSFSSKYVWIRQRFFELF